MTAGGREGGDWVGVCWLLGRIMALREEVICPIKVF